MPKEQACLPNPETTAGPHIGCIEHFHNTGPHVPDDDGNAGQHENRRRQQQVPQQILDLAPGGQFLVAHRHHPANRNRSPSHRERQQPKSDHNFRNRNEQRVHGLNDSVEPPSPPRGAPNAEGNSNQPRQQHRNGCEKESIKCAAPEQRGDW